VRRALPLLLSLVLVGSCSRREEPCECGSSSAVVDATLLAFLSRARSAHHVADAREASGDVAGAVTALRALVEAVKPPGRAPEVEEVLADTRARLADLLGQQGRFDEADAVLDAGLENAPAPTYFRGHLFEVRGAVEERREKALRAAGQGPKADAARERSLAAYEEAMKIQAQVIQGAIPGAAPASPAPSSAK
jgi:tetratricopeptide (TPR) repeat protein